jgi:hypothetical protein
VGGVISIPCDPACPIFAISLELEVARREATEVQAGSI